MGQHTSFQDLRLAPLSEVRQAIRTGAYSGHTAGLAQGYLQANLVIMPESHALDFMRFCQRNSKACPLVGVTDTGDPMMHTLGEDLDIRTDVPAYNIYCHGHLEAECPQIEAFWLEGLVAFAIGCSFTFEHALIKAGISLWHIDHNTTVPMFRTGIPAIPAGPFGGPMVVSMRAIPKEQLGLVDEICRQYPLAHGAPIHVGNPDDIGIADIERPEWGHPAPVPEGSVPVFWACGVTPQVAIEQAGLPLCITHKPGHMLITDIPETAELPVLNPLRPTTTRNQSTKHPARRAK